MRTLYVHVNRLQVNQLVVSMKSEAVKERHWKQMMRRLRVKWVDLQAIYMYIQSPHSQSTHSVRKQSAHLAVRLENTLDVFVGRVLAQTSG